ncbi:hypothetical protein SAMN05216386_2969 [Nitrosospira briensis]|uniref:Uncharacterized protein n=1 Tax=Nitrosospira briensis TaxID=35799 RepID=A0A1I5FD33_9PROT|nr:hypothetical protein SAMN05216386_2969 [Nitrosospira briensis]
MIAGTSRNAWRDLWIKRPEDKWKLANECRANEEAAQKLLKNSTTSSENRKPSVNHEQERPRSRTRSAALHPPAC